ncbi:MAG: hypothetical protein NZ733_00100 [Aigarchaeota archaeon]|nr:hypothetical protein [Aigarchaeota archaeon]MCS7127238.1 hypothetical protein [Candidatus Calditenuaceae archaeon]
MWVGPDSGFQFSVEARRRRSVKSGAGTRELMAEAFRRTSLPERVLCGRYVASSFWEAVNHLGEVRMVLHSHAIEPASGPVLVLLGRENNSSSLKGYVGYLLDMERAVPLLRVRLPAGEHAELRVKGRLEDQLASVARSCPWDFVRVELEFLANPLDVPEERLESIARVPLEEGVQGLGKAR